MPNGICTRFGSGQPHPMVLPWEQIVNADVIRDWIQHITSERVLQDLLENVVAFRRTVLSHKTNRFSVDDNQDPYHSRGSI